MKVYSTLSGKKEEFLPPGSPVNMYVCGVTPYSDSHIGHAMSQVIFDVIRRYLIFRGYRVKYVQNITDVDDKIIQRANQTGISTEELAGKYTASFFEDMDALNIRRADIYPKATGEIAKMLEVVQGLIDKGFAYPSQGSVYFRVRNVPDYGKLSRRSLESMLSAEGAIGEEDKESPLDFVLWKAAKPGEPSWDSPWGKGRPGWHIECSAMSLKYLGGSIDIHGGGQDLIFPHHENEIAQSESFTGVKPFARFWMHNGMVQLGGEKMSKSLGNLVTVKEIREKFSADAIRIFILNSHYRSPLTYSEEALEAAEKATDRLRQVAALTSGEGKSGKDVDSEAYRRRFIEAMDDDFNTAQALGSLFDLAREINRLRDEGYNTDRGRATLIELGDILGLTFQATQRVTFENILYDSVSSLDNDATSNLIKQNWPRLEKNKKIIEEFVRYFIKLRNEFTRGAYPDFDRAESYANHYLDAFESLTSLFSKNDYNQSKEYLEPISNNSRNFVDDMADFRWSLRKNKQWKFADEIRNKLAELGIILEDTPQGTVWKQKR